MQRHVILAGCLAVLFCLSACSSFHKPSKDLVQAEDRIWGLDQAQHDAYQAPPILEKTDEAYVSLEEVEFVQTKLPAYFQDSIVMVEQPLSLPEIADRLAQLTGAEVRMTPYLRSAGNSEIMHMKMPMDFEGKLKGFLDGVAAFYGVYWKYESGVISFFRYDTVVYSLFASLGSLSTSASLTNKSKSDAYSSGDNSNSKGSESIEGEQTTKTSADLNIWVEVADNVKTMLSENGSVVANQSAGTITVTDTPVILERVDTYISEINRKLSRQVAISVQVYNFESSDVENYGVEATFADALHGVQLQGAQVRSSVDGTSPFTASILSGGTWGDFAGSKLVLDALNRVGKTSLVTSGSGITLNNQPMPIQVIRRKGYLESVSSSSLSDDDYEVALNQGQITTGFSMTVTPHILSNGMCALQYNVSYSHLEDIEDITSGNQKIQAPEVSTRSFMQRLAMPVNSTLILAGFKQLTHSHDSALSFFGAGKQHQASDSLVIVVIDLNAIDPQPIRKVFGDEAQVSMRQ